MDERVVQFRVGVTVLAALLITGILVLLFGELPGLLRGSYTIYIKFPSAPGVSQDTPVRKSGILIGRVTKVQFAPDNDVLVTVSINGGVELYRDEVVRIKAGLIGDAELEFVPGAKRSAARVPIEPGDLLAGSVSVDPLQAFANLEGNLNRAADALGSAGEQVSKLARNLNNLVDSNDDQLDRIIDETERSMVAFQKTLANFDNIFGDEKIQADLRRAIADMPNVMRDTRDTLGGMQQTIGQLDNILRNIEPTSKALDEQGPEMVNNLSQSVERLDELLAQVNRFSRALNNRDGTLGQLIYNPELFNNLNQTVRNVNRLTRELEPVVSNAKIFTDKIARHPGIIVRDAVKPGPGLK